MMLRARRAGTEEPEEGRRTSLLVRNRRGTLGEGEEEQRSRAPSRATTEIFATNPLPSRREYTSQNQATHADNTQQTTALPRRRFASSSVGPSRFSNATGSNSPGQRKYLDRSALDRDEGIPPVPQIPDRGVSEDRGTTRHLSMSMGQNVVINRSGTLTTRRNRESGLVQPSSGHGGTYR